MHVLAPPGYRPGKLACPAAPGLRRAPELPGYRPGKLACPGPARAPELESSLGSVGASICDKRQGGGWEAAAFVV